MLAWIGQIVTLRLGMSGVSIWLRLPTPHHSPRELCCRQDVHTRASRRATGHSPPGPARMLTVTGLRQLEAH